MFYYYLRFFKWFSVVFGLHFPFPSKYNKVYTQWLRLWSLTVCAAFVVSYFYPNNLWSAIKVKTHFGQISSANNLIVNVIIILINICGGETINEQIYTNVIDILRKLQIHDQHLKKLITKFYLWISLPFAIFIILIVIEFTYAHPPYTLLFKMPIFLSFIHLLVHLSLLLAALNTVNLRISEKFQCYNNLLPQDPSNTQNFLNYFLFPTIKLFDVEHRKGPHDLRSLCKLYDTIGTCITLLEKSHGIPILLSIWLMFSNAVTGITLITKEQASIVWVVIVRSSLPFLWYFVGCYIDSQLQQEVERTQLLTVKHSIDFRCDNSTREALQTFRQVVAANRLEFTACNLFRLNYATILGTVVNVITYSIILIQIL